MASLNKPFELTGYIKSIPYNKKGYFTVRSTTKNTDYSCYCQFFCPVREGDSIYAVVQNNGSDLYLILKQPFVQIPMDKDSIVRCFIRVLKGSGFGQIKAAQLFDTLADHAGGQDKVINYLSELSELYLTTRDEDLLKTLNLGLKVESVKTLLFWWRKNRDLRRLYLFGLNNAEINSAHMTSTEIYNRCISNPFTVLSIPMNKCEEILTRLNKPVDATEKECGSIARMIYENSMRRSWTGTPLSNVNSTYPAFSKYQDQLVKNYGLVVDLDTVYCKHQHRSEVNTCNWIGSMREADKVDDKETKLETPERESVDFKLKTLSDDQKAAVQGAMDHPISVITGGAGSGKTTIIGEIVHNLELRHIPFLLCAFTGKAVSRVKEAVKRPSFTWTIHRFLRTGDFLFDKIKGPLHIVIDEASMLTMELFDSLMKKAKKYTDSPRITFVGDCNQLDPIGWGALLSEVIKSGTIPVYYLTHCHRTYKVKDEVDGVILNANNIINGGGHAKLTQTPNFIIAEGSIERVYDIIVGYHNANISADQLTIVAPFNKDLDELNSAFQRTYNEKSPSVVDSRGKRWAVNDRVIMTENNYDINVMNGEEGIITDLTDMTVTVKFGVNAHDFALEPKLMDTPGIRDEFTGDTDGFDEKDDLSVKMLTHSFALTVHKAQGSEWNFVVVYIPASKNYSFLNKRILYTALTRAKRAVYLIGDVATIEKTVNQLPSYRCDNLARRLRMRLPLLDTDKVVSLDDPPQEYDGGSDDRFYDSD